MTVSFKTVRNIGLSGMTLIIVIMGLISFIATTRIVNGLTEILQKERPKLESAECIRNCFLDAREIFNAFVQMKEKDINPAVMLMNKAIKESEELKKLVSEEEVAKFITAAKRFRVAIVTYVEESEVDITGARAIEMEKIAMTTAEETEEVSAKLVRDIRAKIKAVDEIILGVSKNSQRMSLVGTLIGIVAGLVVAFFMGRGLSRPIRQLVKGTQRIAKGDLTYRVNVESGSEIGQLSDAFNKMAGDLSVSIQKERELAAVAVAAAETEKKRSEELAKEITERKKAEEELKEAYAKLKEMQEIIIQAEKLNAIGQLASGVAHEVKNPLGIILQSVNYLEGRLPSRESDISDMLDMIKRNIQRADKIIRDLVNFSRASELTMKPEDINSILEGSLTLVQHNIILKHIEIVKNMGSDLPKVLADKGKMEQVFVNLFLNAIQAIPVEGKIFIRSYLRGLEELKNGVGRRNGDYFKLGEEAIVVEIEDTGIGIPEENINKIFNPFFTTKEAGHGAGLGLAVTKNILIMHKGLIEVESKEGKGTKFIITLKKAEGG